MVSTVSGHENHLDIRPHSAQFVQDLLPQYVWQSEIQQHHVDLLRMLSKEVQTEAAVAGLHYGEAPHAQDLRDCKAKRVFVLDDQNRSHADSSFAGGS